MGIPTAGSYDLHRRTNRYHTNPRDAGPAGSFEEGVGEDGGYGDFGIVARDGNVDVGEAVVILAGLIERGEGLWIAGEGAVGGLGDAVPDGVPGAIQPDGEAIVVEQEAVAGLGERPAAEREDGRASAFDGADVLADDGGVDTAEFGFAAGGEDLGDGGIFGGLNLDRKSTRLNSRHLVISYAVFC